MSKEIDNIRRKVATRLSDAGAGSEYGIIEKVDETKRTCSVKVGGIVRENVLLYAVESPDLKGFVFIPKKGSTVLVSRVGSGNRLCVKMFSEVDKVMCTVGDTALQITEAGFKMERSSAGLKKTLSDLCDAIGALTVPTGTGPSGIPINKAKFDTIKQGLNDYLED